MATLLIKESSERSLMRLPHLIELNGQTIGVLGAVGKDAYKEMLRPNLPPRIARIALPAGHYTLCIRSLFRWFYATAELQVEEGRPTIVTFADKEKYWDWVLRINRRVDTIAMRCNHRLSLTDSSSSTFLSGIVPSGEG